MDIILIIVSVIFLAIGVVGTIVPFIPGLPLSWLALLILKFVSPTQGTLSWTILILLGVAVLIISVLDAVLPLWGTKRMGGGKTVVWGATIGLFVGLFFLPFGILFGTFIGAFIGGIVSGSKMLKATQHATGAAIGFFAGLTLKFGMVIVILVVYIRTLWQVVM